MKPYREACEIMDCGFHSTIHFLSSAMAYLSNNRESLSVEKSSGGHWCVTVPFPGCIGYQSNRSENLTEALCKAVLEAEAFDTQAARDSGPAKPISELWDEIDNAR